MLLWNQTYIEKQANGPPMNQQYEIERLKEYIKTLERLIYSKGLLPPPIKKNFLDALDIIFTVVCKVCDVKVSDIMMKSRGEQNIAFARQLIMYFCIEYEVGSYKYIAKRVNRTDHTTPHYAHKKIKILASIPGICRDQYYLCREKIGETLGLVHGEKEVIDYTI